MSNVFEDTRKFTELYIEKTGNTPYENINVEFITKMVNDELEELKEATDETEKIDALLDAVYYICQHIASTGIKAEPIWNLIHNANMTKFGPGGYKRDDGKWVKPDDFKHPDDDIRIEVEKQKNNR